MTLNDLKRLVARRTMFRFDAILSVRLIPILYTLGLAGIALWALNHIFSRFATGLGNGLWGLIETAIFGIFTLVALRIVCEALMVWFKTHEAASGKLDLSRYSDSLIDDVRGAIHDLAEADDDDDRNDDDEDRDETDAPPLRDSDFARAEADPPQPTGTQAAAARREPATTAGQPYKTQRAAKRKSAKTPKSEAKSEE